jgi:hypothetical protein
MNDTIYVDAEFTLPGNLPQPGHKDLAEVFGIPAGGIDTDRPVKSVPGSSGTWQAGIKNCDVTGATRRFPGQIRTSEDFYVK